MAFVGTARRLGDARTTLASMIQGEARSYAGQVAVANVLRNRAESNFGGFGTDPVAQATARLQFQGQAPPTAQSYGIADSLLNGTLPNTLPNALNYAARPGTTAGWALSALNRGQGVNPGGDGNIFWANSRGDAPIYNPSALSGGGSVANNNIPGGTNNSGVQGTGVDGQGSTSVGTEWKSYSEDGKGNASVVLGFPGEENGNGIAGSGNVPNGPYANNEPIPDSSLGIIKIRPNNQPRPEAQGNAGSGNGGQGGNTGGGRASSSSGGSAGGSMTVPQAIDTQTRGNASDTSSLNQTNTANTQAVNKQNKENTEALNKTSTANTKSVTDKAQGIYDATASAWSDYFVRLVFIILGLIAVAAALVALAKPNLPIPGLAVLRASGFGKGVRKLTK